MNNFCDVMLLYNMTDTSTCTVTNYKFGTAKVAWSYEPQFKIIAFEHYTLRALLLPSDIILTVYYYQRVCMAL